MVKALDTLQLVLVLLQSGRGPSMYKIKDPHALQH